MPPDKPGSSVDTGTSGEVLIPVLMTGCIKYKPNWTATPPGSVSYGYP